MKNHVLDRFRVVDLTHRLNPKNPTWSGESGFHLKVRVPYDQGLGLCSQDIDGHLGIGTHMDAPKHFNKGDRFIDQIPIEDLISPACVLNLRAAMEPDLAITPAHIEAFEEKNGKIPKDALVLVSTGWEQNWSDPSRYRNEDPSGRMHFPYISAEAATELLKRDIVGIGIDTLSPDPPSQGDAGYPVHRIILGAGKYILENVANLDQMPPTGAFVICLPPKFQDATESICRIIGLIPS